MNKCIEYLLITAIVVYIVDLSGFTQSWKQAISAKFGGKCRIGKPFDCSLCMTWWVCNIIALISGERSLSLCAYIAGLSFMADIIGQSLNIIKELVKMALRHLYNITQL